MNRILTHPPALLIGATPHGPIPPDAPTPDSIAAARAAQDYGRDLAARQIFGDPDGTKTRVWLARIAAGDRGVA